MAKFLNLHDDHRHHEVPLAIYLDQIQDLEQRLLLQAIFEHRGYDFRQYASASLQRRVQFILQRHGFISASQLIHALLRDDDLFERVLNDFTVQVSDFFRHPNHFEAIKTQVFPYLRTYPEIKIWHAGCSSGEEVYSLAILLSEAGLLERTHIYATDLNSQALQQAEQAIFEQDTIVAAVETYQKSGGVRNLRDYYTAREDHVIMSKKLRERILFSKHNLVSDGVFGEMHLILCQNVLIYFNRDLQNQVLSHFKQALCSQGFLCLGPHESLSHTPHKPDFERFVPGTRLYRKRVHV